MGAQVTYRCPSCRAYASVGVDVPLDRIIICGACTFRARVWWMRGLPKPETPKETIVTEPTDGLEPSKYRVERMGDREGKHAACWYFVLDPHHDPHAIRALQSYAKSCRLQYPTLAADIDDVVKQYERRRVWGVRRSADWSILPDGGPTALTRHEAQDLLTLAHAVLDDKGGATLVYRDLPDGQWTGADT